MFVCSISCALFSHGSKTFNVKVLTRYTSDCLHRIDDEIQQAPNAAVKGIQNLIGQLSHVNLISRNGN